ncbi:MAG: hypothetical protein ABW022_11030 [Actinoplanes sp.]
MSLGLTKPGASATLRHPKTKSLLAPLGVLPSGKVVWPILGGSSDDPDDPDFTGGGGGGPGPDDDDEDDDEDEKPRGKAKSKSVKADEDDDDDDEDNDEEDLRIVRASRQARKYRLQLREAQRNNADLAARIKAIEDQEKAPAEVADRDLTEARSQIQSLTETTRVMNAQLAFFKTSVPGVVWADASDAFAVAERQGLFDDVIDEDGTVDTRELRRSLKDLAKRKPHLVKKVEDDPKARGRKSTDSDEDEEDDDEEPRSRRSAGTMNGNRRGNRQAGPSRESLASKFPVLRRV